MGEAGDRAAGELRAGEVERQDDAHARVRFVDEVHHVVERGVLARALVGRPRAPLGVRDVAGEDGRARAREHGAGAVLVGRRARVDDLALAGRGRGERVHDGVVLGVCELLRLVEHDELDVIEASGASVGARRELDGAAVGEVDGLLAVRAADPLDEARELGVFLVREVADESVERLLCGLHAVRGVEDVPAADRQAEHLVYLDDGVLAVLARHVQAARDVGWSALGVARAPVGQHERLPLDGLHAQVPAQLGGVLALGVGGLAHGDPIPRLLPSAPRGARRSRRAWSGRSGHLAPPRGRRLCRAAC